MRRIPALFFFLAWALLPSSSAQLQPATPQAQPAATPDLPHLAAGTPVKLRMGRTVSSADAGAGETVQLEVVEEVRVENAVAISAGSTALATVMKPDSKKIKVPGGKLAISIDSVNLADGEKAPLRAVKETEGAGPRSATAGANVKILVFLPSAPPYPMLNGKDVIIPKGTAVTAYISEDVPLDLAKFPSRPLDASATTSKAAAVNDPAASSAPTELNISSRPFGAEIDIDGVFVGSTPFKAVVPAGDHTISLRLAGYGPWRRTVFVTGGKFAVYAELSPGGINGDVVSHCSTTNCVDSTVGDVARRPPPKEEPRHNQSAPPPQ